MFESFNQVSEFQSLQRASFPISRNAWVSSQGVCVSVCVSVCALVCACLVCFCLRLSVPVCACLCLCVL